MMKRFPKKLLACCLAAGTLATATVLPGVALPAGSTLVGDVGASCDVTVKGLATTQKGGFHFSTELPDDMLALSLRLYLSPADGGNSLQGIVGGDGQIELTSSGTWDQEENAWLIKDLPLKAGWNDLVLPFDQAASNGLNKTKINFFRLYNIATDPDLMYTMKVSDVKIISMEDTLKMPSHYTGNMLFQQNKPIVLTGTAGAGHTIDAAIYNGSDQIASASATAAADKSWSVSLPAMKGGYTKYTIKIRDNGEEAKTLENVVIGEQWLASGQSNMEYYLERDPEGHDMIVNGPHDEYIRAFLMPFSPDGNLPSGNVPYEPKDSVKSGHWVTGEDGASLGQMSAIAYHFAVKLRQELDVPVGILNTASGSSSIYAWLSRSAIDGCEEVKSYLQGSAQYITEANWNKQGENNFNQMSSLFNQKIAPLTELNISGVIWHQGETNSKDAKGSYTNALELLLRDYSARFRFPEDSMPFIYCHISPEIYNGGSTTHDQLGYFAEDMSAFWAAHPNTTAQCTTYDLPTAYDFTAFLPGVAGEAACHTMYKSYTAARMVQSALAMVYGKEGEYTSPVASGVTFSGKEATVTFDHVGEGLAIKKDEEDYLSEPAGTELRGFAICGADGVYVPAKAEITGKNTVKVWSDTVKNPISVTYGFTQLNKNANLISIVNGVPLYTAVPFRSEELDNAKYYRAHDWTTCDIPQIYHYSDYITAAYHDAWLADGSVTIGCDPSVKTAGNGSLKVAYTTDQNKAFRFGPAICVQGTGTPFPDTDNNYSQFETMSVDIFNDTGRPLQLSEVLFVSGGKRYRPYVLGTTEMGTALSADGQWQTVTFDLTQMVVNDDDGKTAANKFLNAVTSIQFTVLDQEAGASGTIHVDNVQFGFRPDKAEVNKQPLLAAIRSADSTGASYGEAVKVLRDTKATQEQVDEALQKLQNGSSGTTEPTDDASEPLDTGENSALPVVLAVTGAVIAAGAAAAGILLYRRKKRRTNQGQ